MREGIWRLADPKISLASFAALFLGAAAARAAGPLAWDWLAVTVGGIFALEVAKNASGELYDWDSGTDRRVAVADRSPFSGGKRVLVDDLLTRHQTWGVAVVAYALALGAGAAIALWHEPRIWGLGLAGLLLAFFYHAPPFRLSYRGWGELAVALAYGPGIVVGTWLVLRGTMPLRVLLLGAPLGFAIAAFLWINEFPDFEADRQSGKRNLVVRLGRARAARTYVALQVTVYALVTLLPFLGWGWGAFAGWIGAGPAGIACRTILRHPEETAALIPAQRHTLLAFLLLAGGVGAGVLLT